MTDDQQQDIVRELVKSYWMRIETVMNCVSNSVNLDGARAEEVKHSLAADVQPELQQALVLARRIHDLGGTVPGSMTFLGTQGMLQPSAGATDVRSLIIGVVEAEETAIRQYRKIAKLCDGVDYLTQHLCISAIAGQETRSREFRGFLAHHSDDPIAQERNLERIWPQEEN